MSNALEQLAVKVENHKNKRARLEGKLESLMDTLEDEGYSSVEKANKAVKTITLQIRKKKIILNKKIKTFKEKYSEELNG